jgi:Polyphosphate kinase 2 (PPK2)
LHQDGDASKAIQGRKPEKVVVEYPPPEPDYPCYRVEPGGRASLEQKERLQSRFDDPAKRRKFSSNDIKERAYWDAYQKAFEDAIDNCSTEHATWYVVPANKKWYRNLIVARTIADTLEAMDPRYPPAEEGLEKVTIPD